MEVSSTMTLARGGSGLLETKELATAGAQGVSGPMLTSLSSFKIWLAARSCRGMRCVILHWGGPHNGGGAEVSNTMVCLCWP